jgi:CDP-glucose 4,6-dehydratase
MNLDFWRGRRVFITGHTGFKGGWLAAWLVQAGAEITGYALAPNTVPSFYSLCELESRTKSILGDIRDRDLLARAISQTRPEVVFHLAAQSLVGRSYQDPADTFETNVMGTVYLLEAALRLNSVRAVVVATSDKCYEPRSIFKAGYREDDPLGGHDPYSASKACTELAVAAYQRSFLSSGQSSMALATVRAGNVIGGGDWALDRIIPDTVRALESGQPLAIRNPEAVRPWQHVLEPVAGYLILAARLYAHGQKYSGGWNFGPARSDVRVATLIDLFVKAWGPKSWQASSVSESYREIQTLVLDSSKARSLLGWRPCLTLQEAVNMTAEWYRKAINESHVDLYDLTSRQIREYIVRQSEQATKTIATGKEP